MCRPSTAHLKSASPRLPLVATLLSAILAVPPLVSAQDEEEAPKQIVLDRVALKLKSPEEYQIRLQLRPTRDITVSAQSSGIVQLIPVETGQAVRGQAELMRIKSDERQIEQKIASAELAAAKAAHDAAQGNEKKVRAAELDAAQARLDLAEFHIAQTIIRAPIDGHVRDLADGRTVVIGEFVRAGEPVMRLIDPTELWVVVPIERTDAKKGESITVSVEGTDVSGTVQAVVEPTGEFKRLQDLFVSVALAKVIVDNGNGQLQPGQAVTSDMMPRHPIAEVPNSAIRNSGDSQTERMVQVIRDGFVRNLPIQVLGQVGPTHVYVSARFSPGDELIASSSEPVADGSWVRSLLDIPAATEPGESNSNSRNRTPPPPGGTPPSSPNRSRF